MNPPVITKKELFLAVAFSLCIIATIGILQVSDTRTKIVFCDVGQGDGAYIRIKNRFDVVIDAGPDRKILNCLGKYIPFYDRKIELAIISHPQKDHFGGFLYLADRYKIEKLLMTPLDNPSQSFKRLKQKIAEKKISVDFPKAGTKIKILNSFFVFYWPTETFLSSYILYDSPLYDRTIDVNGKQNVLGVSSLDDNNFSLVMLFQEGDFRALFTGDATPKVLDDLIDSRWSLPRALTRGGNNIGRVNILKVPHHGSKNGLTEKFLRLADPRVAVISVGKKNAYGHPHKVILDMLESHNVKIRRTDTEGDVVFKIPNSKL